MPIYEFECRKCGARFEELVPAGAKPLPALNASRPKSSGAGRRSEKGAFPSASSARPRLSRTRSARTARRGARRSSPRTARSGATASRQRWRERLRDRSGRHRLEARQRQAVEQLVVAEPLPAVARDQAGVPALVAVEAPVVEVQPLDPVQPVRELEDVPDRPCGAVLVVLPGVVPHDPAGLGDPHARVRHPPHERARDLAAEARDVRVVVEPEDRRPRPARSRKALSQPRSASCRSGAASAATTVQSPALPLQSAVEVGRPARVPAGGLRARQVRLVPGRELAHPRVARAELGSRGASTRGPRQMVPAPLAPPRRERHERLDPLATRRGEPDVGRPQRPAAAPSRRRTAGSAARAGCRCRGSGRRRTCPGSARPCPWSRGAPPLRARERRAPPAPWRRVRSRVP